MSRRHIPRGAGTKVAGLFRKFVPGLKKADLPSRHHPHAPTGRHDLPENPRIRSSGARDVPGATPDEIAAYNRIRANAHDTPRIARNTGIDQRTLDRVKKHLFLDEHDVQVGPGMTERGRFTPDGALADMWERAEKGTLSPAEQERFKRLVAHEYVESGLMDRGMPYRSDHPDYWNHPELGPGVNNPTPAHHGAHDLAPSHNPRGPFAHYGTLGRDAPDVGIANDLSNLDNLINKIWRGRR